MMNEKKMTKREYFAVLRAIPEVAENPALVAFIDHEIELLSKKNAAEKKPTAVQVANEGIKAEIVEAMTAGTLYTVTDIQKSVPACAELSNQRVSALLRQLVEAGQVVRTEDKRKAYFSLAWASGKIPHYSPTFGGVFFGRPAAGRAGANFHYNIPIAICQEKNRTNFHRLFFPFLSILPIVILEKIVYNLFVS